MKKSIGWSFVLVACLLWIVAIIIPFLSFSIAIKAAIIAGCIIIAEICFWLGAILIGKSLWQLLREKKKRHS